MDTKKLNEEVMNICKDLFYEDKILFIGNLDNQELVHAYEFDDELEIAKISDYIFEGSIYDDTIEAQPWMHKAYDIDQAWDWMYDDLAEEVYNCIENYISDKDNIEAEDIVNYYSITNNE